MDTLFERIGRAITTVAPERTLIITNDSHPDAAADAITSFIASSLAR
jgi:hypothetical protein